MAKKKEEVIVVSEEKWRTSINWDRTLNEDCSQIANLVAGGSLSNFSETIMTCVRDAMKPRIEAGENPHLLYGKLQEAIKSM